ncbi:transcription termination/antitermination protein NusG [Acidimangrovimonas pyrenivorans]|uniref:Transcription termination/antitermination protein NusG n=1 Tax=Acidimangrovimonas pyrenivorans TaxID=2030798 RepID=A0ABV7AN62_9RHOB
MVGEGKACDGRHGRHQAGASWYLVQVKPNSVRIAERNLRRQGFRVFAPTHEETRRTRGRFVTALRPLFPGYLFVAFAPSGGGWRAINSTYGVSRLVGFGAQPAAVPSAIISQLMRRCGDDGKLLSPPVVRPGDQVHLSSGPFADFVATVEQMAPDQRVWVLLDLMGREQRVAVRPEALRVVNRE